MLPLHQLADELNRERLTKAQMRRATRRKRSWRSPLWPALRRARSIPANAVPPESRASDHVSAEPVVASRRIGQ